MITLNTPSIRVRSATQCDLRPDGQYVLYWMTAYRRLASNFALDRAVELAVTLNKPLLVFEGLRIGYRWASDPIGSIGLCSMECSTIGKPQKSCR